MKFIPFVLLTMLLTGCYNDRGINFPYPENNNYNNKPVGGEVKQFVPGEVNFLLKDSVSFETLADTIYSYNNLSIDNVSGLQYTSDFFPDSAQTIDSVLNSRAYINNLNVTVSYLQSGAKMMIAFGISNFNQDYISDWNSLVKRFNLEHLPSGSQEGILKVPDGRENLWINNLLHTKLFVRLGLLVLIETPK
jgi:hypothetical protein